MKRRKLILGTGTGLAAATAGCTGLFAGEQSASEDQEYRFTFTSRAFEETTAVEIRILDLEDELIYQNSFDVEPDSREFEEPLDSVPASLLITIDDSQNHVFNWPASHEEEHRRAQRADIHYDPERSQQVQVSGSDFSS